jgi:uncharacterized protein YndB with AHSA1/START domain
MRHLLLAATAALALAGTAQAAPSWRDFPGVENSSYVEPSGDRAIQLSAVIPAPPAEVYKAFTTTEGFKSWAVPVTKVDLRIGGMMESSYDAKARLGDPSNIKNEIVAYVPDRLLVIRNHQAPPGFADPELFGKTVTVMEFQPVGPKATKVVITNAGYGQGERWSTLYGHFEWGDAYMLAQLRKRFETGPTDWAKEAEQASARTAANQVERKAR